MFGASTPRIMTSGGVSGDDCRGPRGRSDTQCCGLHGSFLGGDALRARAHEGQDFFLCILEEMIDLRSCLFSWVAVPECAS